MEGDGQTTVSFWDKNAYRCLIRRERAPTNRLRWLLDPETSKQSAGNYFAQDEGKNKLACRTQRDVRVIFHK